MGAAEWAQWARFSWGALAALGGVFSVGGQVFSARAIKRVRARRSVGGDIARRLYRRDSWIFWALFLVGSGGLLKALVLIMLARWYGSDLDPILADLLLPVFAAYLLDTVCTLVVTAVAPIWLAALYERDDRRPARGIPEQGAE